MILKLPPDGGDAIGIVRRRSFDDHVDLPPITCSPDAELTGGAERHLDPLRDVVLDVGARHKTARIVDHQGPLRPALILGVGVQPFYPILLDEPASVCPGVYPRGKK